MHSGFVPLRVFSAYTMLEGAIEPKAIAKRARELGFPAVALCDRNGLYAAMAFSDACRDAGVQPIIGTLLAVARPGTEAAAKPTLDWLALYAQDEAGYGNLCALVSRAHLGSAAEHDAHVTFADLEGHTDGLLALTAGAEGALVRLFAAGQKDAALAYADRLQSLFPGRLHVEISRRLDPEEGAAEADLLALAYARDLPLVATNPACFAESDFHEAHDAMLCIAGSDYLASEERRRSSADAWMKPASDMKLLFADLPEAIDSTLMVARRCAYAAPKRDPILPSMAGDRTGEAVLLRERAHAGLTARLARIAELDDVEVQGEWTGAYRERLDYELGIIEGMGFAGYFLIVADFIQWAKGRDIPVGPGRGSGAGSAVAWALTITDLDPIKLGLLFERFLNPERVSMPDFDIDFCETRRGEVIRYVQERYGQDRVAQIITFGTMKARAVLRDVGRVLQMSYGHIDRLTKLVPNHPTDPWTLSRALNGVGELVKEVETDPQVRHLFDLAMKLEGLPRHSSTHAAGVVIGDRPLAELVPLYRDPRSDMPVTQFDMKYAEGAGLVKFDFLGLKTLSVLKEAVRLLALRGVSVDLDGLGWDDPGVYELLKRGDTVGVFQLESEGMRRTLSAVRPSNFGDIIALVSLYRPGPMDNIPLFGDRKNGRAEIAYPHPLLADILGETYGIFVYQEQVMQAAQVLAGYSLGGADLLRRAMGKKKKEEMDAQRASFVQGCAEVNKIPVAKANELFDLIDKFAGYGFNKSHAAAYALLAYQTAWLKAHHPHEFFAASMSFDIHQTDKLAIFVDDMKRLQVECLPPCLNHSRADFSVEAAGEGLAVRYALGALKGVGEGAMERIVAEREAAGPFATLDDFANRIDPRALNKRQIETLAGAGGFDAIEPNRAGVSAAAERIMAVAQGAHEARNSGQGGLFADGPVAMAAIQLPLSAKWSLTERTAAEHDAFGFYFSAHPLDRYAHLARSHGAQPIAGLGGVSIPPGERVGANFAALLTDARWRTSARGNRYLMVGLSDTSGQVLASCFDEGVGTTIEAMAREGRCALVGAELDRRAGEDMPRVAIRSVKPLDDFGSDARLVLDLELASGAPMPRIADLLADRGGGRGEVVLHAAIGDDRMARVVLGRGFRLDPELAGAIEALQDVSWVKLNNAQPARVAAAG